MAASKHVTPISRREDALAIVRRLVEAGHVAYFAGGCVRDALLGLEPKDYDVATSATPDQARVIFPRGQGVGQAFGVLLIREGRSQIELATFRADGDYTDGRRPDDVRYAGPEEDAQRRDFTINGLYYDPLADRVIDFVGGVADLRDRTLRAIGDPAKRFAEDYLRLLRAVRFAARFGLKIDPATADAIRANAHKLPRIAPERIADELRAMLTVGRDVRVEAGESLEWLGIEPVILRHVLEAMQVADIEPVELDDRTFWNLPRASRASFALALSALCMDALMARGLRLDLIFGPDAIVKVERALRQTLRLSNDESAAIKVILGGGDLVIGEQPGIARVKRFLARPYADDALALLAAIRDSGWHGERVQRLFAQIDAFAKDHIAPPPLITGDDLAGAGHAPGPAFKVALDAAYDAQLEDRARTPAEAMAIARAILGGA